MTVKVPLFLVLFFYGSAHAAAARFPPRPRSRGFPPPRRRPPAASVIALPPGACAVGDPAGCEGQCGEPAPPLTLAFPGATPCACDWPRGASRRRGGDPGLRRRLPLPRAACACGPRPPPGTEESRDLPGALFLPRAPVTGKPRRGGAWPAEGAAGSGSVTLGRGHAGFHPGCRERDGEEKELPA